MGCITSTKKLHELRNHGQNENVFRVRVVRLLSDSPTVLTGYLELTPRELIFYAPGREPVVWALQHLRRYGLSGDLFSFEAGRRCMSGPGIYNFRCQDAEAMYPMFQRYINAVNTEQTFVGGGGGASGVGGDRPSSANTVMMRLEPNNPHTNTYLEPAPTIGSSGGNNFATRTNFNDTQSGDGSPLSPTELDSPDSLPSLAGLSNDMMLMSQTQAQTAYTPSGDTYANTNLYFDQPMRTAAEHNNNKNSTGPVSSGSIGNNSNFSTLNRPTLLRGCSLDVPPLESAPNVCQTDALHMYANIDTPGACSLRDRLSFENTERCYENVNRLDLPLLLQHSTQREVSQHSVLSGLQSHQPPSPTISTNSGNASGGVKYIVLDLDQPRSPTQCSPKMNTGFGSGLSLTPSEADRVSSLAGATAATSEQQNTPSLAVSTPTTTTTTPTATLEQHKSETSLGYSTIDFIKTWALIKSTTHGAEFDRLRTHEEDVRLTSRHSKCVRKSYSVSE